MVTYIITNHEEIISDVQIHSEGMLPIRSDYYPVSLKLSSPLSDHKTVQKSIRIFDYYKGDYRGLNDILHNTDFSICYQSDDVESVWEFIKSVLLAAIKTVIYLRQTCDIN